MSLRSMVDFLRRPDFTSLRYTLKCLWMWQVMQPACLLPFFLNEILFLMFPQSLVTLRGYTRKLGKEKLRILPVQELYL